MNACHIVSPNCHIIPLQWHSSILAQSPVHLGESSHGARRQLHAKVCSRTHTWGLWPDVDKYVGLSSADFVHRHDPHLGIVTVQPRISFVIPTEGCVVAMMHHCSRQIVHITVCVDLWDLTSSNDAPPVGFQTLHGLISFHGYSDRTTWIVWDEVVERSAVC